MIQLLAGQTTDLSICFSEVPYNAAGAALTATEVRNLLGNPTNASIGNLISNDGGLTWTTVLTTKANYEGNATVTVADGRYYDSVGNVGNGNNDNVVIDTLPPSAKTKVARSPNPATPYWGLVQSAATYSATMEM